MTANGRTGGSIMNDHASAAGHWTGPRQMIPMQPEKASDANVRTRQYFDSILVTERLIGSCEADTTLSLFGRTYASPIMLPAFSHLNHDPEGKLSFKPMNEYALAAKELNLLNFVGMETDETFRDIVSVGADTVRIIKPFRDHSLIETQMKTAKECGAVAVGIDIDHIFGHDGRYDVVDGATMGSFSEEDLRNFTNLAHSLGLPMIIKGVLGTRDALLCAEAGCDAIFVSHHHGRMPYAVPPLAILPDILKVLGPQRSMKVFVDCGIETGSDVFKALAIGADAVSVGRAILSPLLKDGAKGVEAKITAMNQELKMMMGFTGIPTLSDMTAEVLW